MRTPTSVISVNTGVLHREIGERIRTARKAAGFTQQDLSFWLGVSRVSVANYELGIQAVSVAQLYRISSIFETSIFHFIPEVLPSKEQS